MRFLKILLLDIILVGRDSWRILLCTCIMSFCLCIGSDNVSFDHELETRTW